MEKGTNEGFNSSLIREKLVKNRMILKVNIRMDLGKVRPEASQIDGNVYYFSFGWIIEESDSSLYVGESAMIPRDPNYPEDAPNWIASGDLMGINKFK